MTSYIRGDAKRESSRDESSVCRVSVYCKAWTLTDFLRWWRRRGVDRVEAADVEAADVEAADVEAAGVESSIATLSAVMLMLKGAMGTGAVVSGS